ncbi:hypothetical protein COT47_05105 [Candidatus Woesearchaeota archaeon CG08_land_8_20_14_0_20_43_7]|nr:MAG: hypothetical protein COT47_05105 [Candidatus Woesearchaeota archaeon CG08_land_8_20_14_0_20_43_7]
MVTYKELLQKQLVKKLEKVEKEKYVLFHLDNYKIDLDSSEPFMRLGNPKYTVIAGYYAMLNATLWNFAKHFNLKMSEKDIGVHTNCLIVLDEVVKDKKRKEQIIRLLEEAKVEFNSFTILKKNSEETLPLMLRHCAEKRKKYIYYSTERNLPKSDDRLNEAKNFIDTVVKPYVSMMEKLKC